MNDDELKNLWQRQPLREPHVSSAQLISAMQNKMAGFRLILNRRDTWELLACAVAAITSGFFYVAADAPWPISRFGDLIVIGSSIVIAWKLVHARRSTPAAPPGATIVDSLRAELNTMRAQSRLLGSILWWYLLPLGIGLVVATWGRPINLHAKIPATVFYIALGAFVYWLNQRARCEQLLPVEAQLESLLRSAETGEPLDESQRANLRPIILSMAAASQVKPAEFKVAFWQIAIYGVPAIVGIWFFLILGLNGDILKILFRNSTDPFKVLIYFISIIFSWQNLVWMLPFFLAGLLYSWLLQKLTKRAVGISTLGVHLHKGLNLILWDEIKEVRILRILNIRSLWLIRDSGEKMIMRWTSLERHSDLKAAVEQCAPPEHPLREHVRLLKRR